MNTDATATRTRRQRTPRPVLTQAQIEAGVPLINYLENYRPDPDIERVYHAAVEKSQEDRDLIIDFHAQMNAWRASINIEVER